jgi:hypothetical protein
MPGTSSPFQPEIPVLVGDAGLVLTSLIRFVKSNLDMPKNEPLSARVVEHFGQEI